MGEGLAVARCEKGTELVLAHHIDIQFSRAGPQGHGKTFPVVIRLTFFQQFDVIACDRFERKDRALKSHALTHKSCELALVGADVENAIDFAKFEYLTHVTRERETVHLPMGDDRIAQAGNQMLRIAFYKRAAPHAFA